MICKNCGNEVNDGSAFCTACGAPQQPDVVDTKPVATVYAHTAEQLAELSSLGNSALIFGILSLCFSAVLGLIFAIIGRGKAKKYLQIAGELTGKAKVGNILSNVGLIYNIVACAFLALFVVFYAFYILVMIIALVSY